VKIIVQENTVTFQAISVAPENTHLSVLPQTYDYLLPATGGISYQLVTSISTQQEA